MLPRVSALGPGSRQPCLARAARLASLGLGILAARAALPPTLPGTAPLTWEDDLSVRMVAGIERYLAAETTRVTEERATFWRQLSSDLAARDRILAPLRLELARRLGAAGIASTPVALELVATTDQPARLAATDRFTVDLVRWNIPWETGPAVHGHGLLLRPVGPARARVIAIPDADQTPELICGLTAGLPPEHQYARRLAEQGCVVIVPRLLDRSSTHSANAAIGRFTNQPHREFIYRQAFALGRHPIGLELGMLLAAGNWLAREPAGGSSPLGIAGWGEGGLLAFHAAAIDPRFSVVAVSGYFGPREDLATEPIYRNVFGLLRRFGDAEITRLILPRTLIIEPSRAPEIEGPPAPTSGPAARAGAAPGRIRTPAPADVDREVARARQLAGPEAARLLVSPPASDGAAFSEATLGQFLQRLDPGFRTLAPPGPIPQEMRANFNAADFQRTLVDDWSRHLQSLIAQSRDARHRALWQPAPKRDPEAWRLATPANRERFYGDVIGRLRAEALPLNPRTRPLPPAAAWTGYEVVLDVAPEVFAWGYLLFPRDLKAGERRPVVVAQHGLEGLPADLINEDSSSRAFAAYKAFASRLAERGFIVFAPHNPYRGDRFRERQRQAHPLGLTLFSFITAQHERLLDWLTTLPQVDPARIGFYGLSYGGTTALRVPALLERYAAVVCSGNFNEWVWKLCTTEWVGSYVFTKEYEMPEFNLGAAFNHAEMAGLIAPRPFMVERGHSDGVGTDEWVSFEYARVRRLYDHLRIPERTTIEYFDGPHTIHGVGSFEFLHRHLAWPVPGTGQRP